MLLHVLGLLLRMRTIPAFFPCGGIVSSRCFVCLVYDSTLTSFRKQILRHAQTYKCRTEVYTHEGDREAESLNTTPTNNTKVPCYCMKGSSCFNFIFQLSASRIMMDFLDNTQNKRRDVEREVLSVFFIWSLLIFPSQNHCSFLLVQTIFSLPRIIMASFYLGHRYGREYSIRYAPRSVGVAAELFSGHSNV